MTHRILVNRDDLTTLLDMVDRGYVAPEHTPALSRLRRASEGAEVVRFGLVETGLGVAIGPKENGEYLRLR